VFDTPFDRPTRSELWAVGVEGGAPRRISVGDAVQPSWSPHGHRIAYWGLVEGGSRRDLWTIPAAGGEPVPVTQDEAVDWSPAWAPRGDSLYFSSDRGGSMNLWRIPIDERSGRVLGEPERVTTPSAFAHHATFSADGSRLAYISTDVTEELQRVRLDGASGHVAGEPMSIARDLRRVSFPHVSPDGDWLVYERTEPREDIFLSRIDGSDRRALTDDAFFDRRPRFSPDGRRIAFYTNRDGQYEVWTLDRDGSNLRPLTHDPERRNARYPIWSPDGSRLLYSRDGVTGLIVAADGGPGSPVLRELPPYDPKGDSFDAFSWCPDGRFIAGYLTSLAGQRSGITLFDLERNAYVKLTDFGQLPEWLPDGRRLVFEARSSSLPAANLEFPGDDSLFLVDRVTRRVEPVLRAPGASLGYPTVSPDGRWLVYVRTVTKADVWMLAAAQPAR
jgi:TolB protein